MAGPKNRLYVGPVPARKRLAAVWLAAGIISFSLVAPAGAATTTLPFGPEADTWVDASQPTLSFGTSSQMRVDTSPQSQAYLRFKVAGLAGRSVRRVRLRLFQRDASNVGGRVFKMSSNSWAESTTWNTRPAIDGPLLATFGAVQAGSYYEVDLGPGAVSADGAVSFGMDSTSGDGSTWGTRNFTSPPQLLVDVETPAGTVLDGVSEVAGELFGSGTPTYYAGNRRLAVTASGRLLTVHGRHAQGVQLAWRDPAGGWQRQSTGARSDGLLLSGTGTGDWPAAIAVARDAAGEEHAWVVWAGPRPTTGRSLQMVRLSNLDAPAGPTVGPTQTIDTPALGGAYKPDIAFERAPDGSSRGVIVWSRQSGIGTYDIVTGWFTDLGSSTPAVTDRTVIHTSDSTARHGSLVPGNGRTRVIARSSSAFRVYSHPATAPLASWTKSATVGASLGSSSTPAGVELTSGDLLAVGEGTGTDNVLVQRFSADGTVRPVELSLTGYRHPTITTDGTDAWVVMVRALDGAVVSRQFTPGSGWSAADRIEIAAGPHAWPNAARTVDGRLRFVVQGAGSGESSSVLAFQRLK